MWDFDLKYQPDNELSTKKISSDRPVICGNYEETSSAMEDLYPAVASAAAFNMFVAYGAIADLEWRKYNFITAFLNSVLKEKDNSLLKSFSLARVHGPLC